MTESGMLPPAARRPSRVAAVGRIALVALTGLSLLGCMDSADRSDLVGFVGQVKARPGGAISPVPEFKTYETFAYRADGLRDPFEPLTPPEPAFDALSTGPQPNLERNREALEGFPLDALKFVGHLELDGNRWGIITTPDEFVHWVRPGNYMGQNFGKITDISEGQVNLVELVPNGSGGWIERDAALALQEE